MKIRFYLEPETGLPHIYQHHVTEEEGGKLIDNKFPPGWDESKVKGVLDHYENQTEEEAASEDEAVYELATQHQLAQKKPA